MSLELVRFHNLPANYAGDLNTLVRLNQPTLEARYMLGTVARYGADLVSARRSFDHARRQDAEATSGPGITRYGVIERPIDEAAMDGLVGVLTLFRRLPVQRLRLPLPPALALGALSTSEPFGPHATNVTGWVHLPSGTAKQHDIDRLSDVYADGLNEMSPGELPWTVEPAAHPRAAYALAALDDAGFAPITDKPHRYDVGESAWVIPPQSLLYIHGRIPEDV